MMKRKYRITRIAGCLSALSLIFFACFISARAQSLIQPFVECVEREHDSSGAFTDNYTVYFGYTSRATSSVYLPYRSANNFYSPDIDVQNPPTNFVPGVHRRVVAPTLPISSNITWFLGTSFVVGNFSNDKLCSDNGANSRLITYQGKLTDGAAAANGTYDLRFQLFNAVTGGEARTTQIALENVTVTNGIFTVQLDLGANAVLPGGSATAPSSLQLNPAILDAENSFFEIGARAGTSIGAYTTLAPRQPLTAVPLAMRAESATVAYRAVNADNATNATNATNAAQLGGVAANQYIQTNDARLSDTRVPTAGSANYIQNTTTQQANSNFNISGGGTIGGTLTVSGTVSSGCRAGFTAVANGRLCISETQPADTFNNAAQICTNMGARIGNSSDVSLSFTLSGFNYFAATNPSSEPIPKGWLADIINDNVRATWNANNPTQDFDGTPLDVNSGGTGGTAPRLLYRCVY